MEQVSFQKLQLYFHVPIFSGKLELLKIVAFIAGKKNPATQIFFIRFPKGEIASKIQFRPT